MSSRTSVNKLLNIGHIRISQRSIVQIYHAEMLKILHLNAVVSIDFAS